MLPPNEDILIDYLDNNLQGEEKLKAEQLLREDPAASLELEHFMFSVELIREIALLEQVKTARKEHAGAATAKVVSIQQQPAVVRSISKIVMRAAAVVLVFLIGASVVKFVTTSPASVYNKNFNSFELNTSRGVDNESKLEQAYRQKDWTGVQNAFALQSDKNAKAWFLEGMAAMELKNFDKSIIAFNKVMAINKSSTDPAYADEAEYYLALSYLAAQQPNNAVPLLKDIRSNKNHLFYAKAHAISGVDLWLLEK